MFDIKYLYTIAGMVTFLQESTIVSAQRLTIQPSTISVGGDMSSATASPTTVVMECSPDGLNVNKVFSMYIQRESFSFAEVVIGEAPTLSAYAPNDIKTKNPTLDGSIDGNNPFASRLRATFLASRMNCVDEATYRCYINYKPQNSDSADASDEESLNVNVLPRDLQISAARTQDFNLTPIQNLSIINRGEQLEVSCTGYVGDSQTTVIEWFRKVLPNMFFQRFYPTQAGDSIDEGFPSSYTCEYMRTSKLRYTVTSTDSERTAFRCEVGTIQASGTPYRVHSQEFHITGYNPSSGMTTVCAWKTVALWVSSLLVFVIV